MSAKDKQVQIKEVLPNMPKEKLLAFKEVLNIQSNSDNETMMVSYIVKFLVINRIDYNVDIHGNILVTKGSAELYPCVVAHMDTVHDLHEDFNVKIKPKGNRQIAKACTSNGVNLGVGGDDKCGVFTVLEMLRHFDNIKAVFFTQEETGLIGSGNINHEFFNNCMFIAQSDRWGRSDFICRTFEGSTVSDEFLNECNPVLNTYGYKEAEGLITDSIGLWQDGVGVSCINISCGYYEHHTNNETIDINELWNSVLFTRDLIETLSAKDKRYEAEPSINNWWSRPKHYHSAEAEWFNDWAPGELAGQYSNTREDEDIIDEVFFNSGAETFKEFADMNLDSQFSGMFYEYALHLGYAKGEQDFAIAVEEMYVKYETEPLKY